MSLAGIVCYKFGEDGSLQGRWSHMDFAGVAASERALGGTPGIWPGSYQVEIDLPDGTRIFEGILTIENLNDSFRLTWDGFRLVPSKVPDRYTGIGLLIEEDSLAATFQASSG